jgi:hypothetical protein
VEKLSANGASLHTEIRDSDYWMAPCV